MTSPKPSSPLSLLTLPVEFQSAILTHLRFFDLQAVRSTNRYFHTLLPPPTHADILSAETIEHGFLACVGCTRLRPVASFSPKMCKSKKFSGGTQAHNRFCIECGRRPLPGTHRYMPGCRWKENGAPFVRCLGCKIIAPGPEDQRVLLCFPCHTQDLERIRAARELERVRREAKGREDRRLLREKRRLQCEVRRINWVDSGRYLSDFSSADPREQDDSEDESDWGQDDDMDYSGHS